MFTSVITDPAEGLETDSKSLDLCFLCIQKGFQELIRKLSLIEQEKMYDSYTQKVHEIIWNTI